MKLVTLPYGQHCSSEIFGNSLAWVWYCTTVTMVFYLNLCFIVNLMPFTVYGQPFRTMFYISMHFCDFIVVCTSSPCVYSLSSVCLAACFGE